MNSEKSCSENHIAIIIRSFVISCLFFTNSTLAYDAIDVLPNIRIAAADNKFDNTYQVAAVFERSAPKILRAQHLEIAIGSMSTSQESETFISLGPVWRFPSWHEDVFLDFGFSPTFLSGSTFNGRETGGNFHFTTSMSIGLKLGRRRASSISFRIQHMSNGGIKGKNPGLDMVGLVFSFKGFK